MTSAQYRARLKGRRCYVGMDLSSTKDLTALEAVFPDEDCFDVLSEYFVPQGSIRERSTRDRVPYEQWAREGFLRATPGTVVDYEAVRAVLVEWLEGCGAGGSALPDVQESDVWWECGGPNAGAMALMNGGCWALERWFLRHLPTDTPP